MDANLTVSRDLLRCLEEEEGFQTRERFHVVYNGVDAARLKPTGASLRSELGLSNADALLLGMVGNFYADARKDQLTVCRALPRLFTEAPHAHFVFVGAHDAREPRLYEECVGFCRERGISERVHFLGKRADIPDILDALDVFVLSSAHEGLGIAAIEAMMVGVATVVSDIGPLLEVAGGGDYAKVFRTGDAEDLSARLLELVSDTERRIELGARGREWAMRQFRIESHIKSLLRLYDSIAAKPALRA
jgi:glycosyltransferase involved in cell wall biosynthesis